MKKTLVALAALAAVGSSFAQSTVNLTGTFASGYESRQSAAGAKNSGLGVDTAAVQFSAVEDMGAGMKVSAKVSIGNMVRNNNVGGEDANVTFSGGFGSFYLTTFESAGSGVHQIASAGVPGYDLQGAVFGANANIDLIGYSSWDMSGFKFHVNYVDRGPATFTAPSTYVIGNNVGLAQGTDGTSSANPSFGLAGTYTQGPINARLDYTGWTRLQEAGGASTGIATNPLLQPKDRIRLSGTYDFGMAKVGGGYSILNRDLNGAKVTETTVSVSAPIGAARVGFSYGKSDDTTGAGTVKSGYTLGGQYDLSKRTNVGASLFSWKTDGVTGDNTGFRVLVAHSF